MRNMTRETRIKLSNIAQALEDKDCELTDLRPILLNMVRAMLADGFDGPVLAGE